jgi:hypothetical protein
MSDITAKLIGRIVFLFHMFFPSDTFVKKKPPLIIESIVAIKKS